MLISGVRHDWPEKAPFVIQRPEGLEEYTFLHFTTNVEFYFDGQPVQARPGACIFYSPGIPQWFFGKQDVIHNWLHTDSSLQYLLERYNVPQNTLFYPAETAFISELFRKLEMEFYSSNAHKQELMEGYVREFIIRLSRTLHDTTPSPVPQRTHRHKLYKLRQHILSQPEHKWTVGEMAALVSLSPSRFHALYKAVFGTSPLQDVIDAKIGYAKSLLLSNEQLTLPTVAEKLGYNDQYHFIRQFKATTGMTPGRFRKEYR